MVIKFGGDVVYEDDGVFATVFKDVLGLGEDEGADKGFLLSA